jgi:hypothetical protein
MAIHSFYCARITVFLFYLFGRQSLILIVYRYVTTSAVVAVNGGNPLFTAPGYLFNFGDDAKPVYPKTHDEFIDKMEELQMMADERLDKKFRQNRGSPSNEGCPWLLNLE